MITDADINKLKQVFATREELDLKIAALTDVFYTKSEMDKNLDKRFNQVLNSIDNLTKLYLSGNQELVALGHRTTKLENWAGKVGPKVGLKLRH
jgi:hypothetical protein